MKLNLIFIAFFLFASVLCGTGRRRADCVFNKKLKNFFFFSVKTKRSVDDVIAIASQDEIMKQWICEICVEKFICNRAYCNVCDECRH